jgi:hypothetical protein
LPAETITGIFATTRKSKNHTTGSADRSEGFVLLQADILMGMGSCKAAGRDGAPEEPMILVATVEEGFIRTSALGWAVTAKKKKRKISKRRIWISETAGGWSGSWCSSSSTHTLSLSLSLSVSLRVDDSTWVGVSSLLLLRILGIRSIPFPLTPGSRRCKILLIILKDWV